MLAHLFRAQNISLNHSDLRNADPKVSGNCVSELLFSVTSQPQVVPQSDRLWWLLTSIHLCCTNLRVTTECECSIWCSPLLQKGVGGTAKAVLSISMVLERAELALSHPFPQCSVLSLPFPGIFSSLLSCIWVVWNYFVIRMAVSC